MKVKVFTSILVIIALVALITGGTVAYFFDSEKVANNSFAAGSLDLVLTPGDADSTTVVPFTLENVKPGDSAQKIITITNNGTVDGTLDIALIKTSDDENGLLEPETERETLPNGKVTNPDYEGNGGELDIMTLFSLFIDVNNDGVFNKGDIQLAYNGQHKEDGYRGVGVEYPSIINSMLTPWRNITTLKAGESVNLVINWTFPTETIDTNYSQNMAMTDVLGFDAVFTLNQAIAQSAN